jgi:hypothetical protein
MEELFNYYSLDEAVNKDLVINKLKTLKRDCKIELNFDGDIFKIKDIDLEESEIDELIQLFEENDVFPYYDREDDEDDDMWDNYYDEDDDY